MSNSRCAPDPECSLFRFCASPFNAGTVEICPNAYRIYRPLLRIVAAKLSSDGASLNLRPTNHIIAALSELKGCLLTVPQANSIVRMTHHAASHASARLLGNVRDSTFKSLTMCFSGYFGNVSGDKSAYIFTVARRLGSVTNFTISVSGFDSRAQAHSPAGFSALSSYRL